jgi:hypothetical protein
VLTLVAGRSNRLGRGAAGRGQGAAGRPRAAGSGVVGCGVVVPDRSGVGAVGVGAGASVDRDEQFRAVDGRQAAGWGYEALVRDVSDSLHLRRFCLIGIYQRVPDESTIRKLARRLRADVVAV